jgi:hypothetical protein
MPGVLVSTPMEFPDVWERTKGRLRVPDNLELIAMYRLGYLPAKKKRPRADRTSAHRKRLPPYVLRDPRTTPAPDADRTPPPERST